MPINLDNIDIGSFKEKKPTGEELVQQDISNKARINVAESLKVNPEEHAKNARLSRESGLPTSVVETDPVAVENDLNLSKIDFNQMSTRNPNTAKFMTNFNNAAIAREDIDEMKKLENIFNFKKTFSGVGESIGLSFDQFVAGIQLSGADSLPNRRDQLIPYGALPVGIADMAPQLSIEFAEQMGIMSDDDLTRAKEDSVWQILKEIQAISKKRSDLTPEDLSMLESGVRAGIESLGVMAPGFALMLASGGRAAPMLMTMGLQTKYSAYASGRNDGLTPEQAQWYSTIDAVIEVGTEILPTKTLETILGGGKDLGKEAIKFAVREMGTEQLATLGQSINAYLFGIDEQMNNAANVEEMVQIQAERQALTAIATVVAAGTQLAAVSTVAKTVQYVTDKQTKDDIKSDKEQQTIDDINEAAQEFKMREHSQDSFKQFVKDNDGDDNSQIYIDGVQVKLYLNNKDIENDPAAALLSEHANKAAEEGNDLAIPIEEFAAVIAGTEHFDALRDHMTMSEDSASRFRKDQTVTEHKAYISKLVDDAQTNLSEYVEAQEIYESVRVQLIDTGMVSPANAKVMAKVVPAWATVFARDNGLSIKEAYELSGIVGPQTGEATRLQNEAIKKPVIPKQQMRDRIKHTAPEKRVEKKEAFEDLRKDDRRKDDTRREELSKLAVEEQYNLIYRNELTGLNNRRAFNEDIKEASVVISIDADSLGITNDSLGHDAGDQMLKLVAQELNDATGGKAYHISGDEFYALGQSKKELEQAIVKAQEKLAKKNIASDKGTLAGLQLTYGVGTDKKSADTAMEKSKKDKEAEGTRAPKGTVPAGMRVFSERFKQIVESKKDKPAAATKQPIETAGEFTKTTPEEFTKFITAAKAENDFGPMVFQYDTAEYGAMNLYTMDDGKVGFAVKSDGDLVSVFKHPDSTVNKALDKILPTAIKLGATKLDAFEGFLTKQYKKHGFKEVGRDGFSDEFAPPDWDKATMGTPDVVFMRYRQPKEEGLGETISINGVNKSTRNSEGNLIAQTKEGVENFYKWFGDSKVVDENGDPLVVYHGTTHKFTEFKTARGNLENDMGAGFYFTNDADDVVKNYDGDGPDLTARIDLMAERISDNEEIPIEDAQTKAASQLRGDSDRIIEAYLSFKNPLMLGGENETKFDYAFDEDTDVEEGMMVELHDAIMYVAADYNVDGKKIFEAVEINEPGAAAVVNALSYADEMASVKNDEGDLIPGEFIRRVMTHLGFDGIIDNTVVDKFSAMDLNEGTVHFVTVNQTAIKSVDNTGGFDENNPNIYNQKDAGYYDAESSIIRLTEAANLSTFLHEFAHFMYEMELKSSTEKVQQINNWFLRNSDNVVKEANEFINDEETVPDFTRHPVTANDLSAYLSSGTTGDVLKDNGIRHATHEQFARGWEAYLMEGKAPSMEMRNVFRTIARWFVELYESIKDSLNVNLDNEMRQVFDRMIATEEQIAAAEARIKVRPLFTDAAMAGMSEEKFAKYKEQQNKIKDKQHETLRDKLIAQLTRQSKQWWKDEKLDVIDEEIERLKDEPIYRAIDTLLNGEIKLDHAAVKELAGETKTDKRGIESVRIPEQMKNMTVKGAQGIHPDEAAGLFGFGSGDELIDTIVNTPKIKQAAESNAQAIMLERHGDIMNDGTIEQQADEALQNEERAQMLIDELKVLRKGTNTPNLERQAIKDAAVENIGKLSYRQIHPGKYRKAEIIAAQESAAALETGNKEEAAQAKLRQIMNHHLATAATDARNNILDIVEHKTRYNKKQVQVEIMKAENGYWGQLVKVLSRFEFRKAATLKSVDKVNQDINSWAKERIDEDGDGLVLSPVVLDEGFKTHWKNVTYAELQGIHDSVKNIEHVARYGNKMKRMGEEIDFKKLVSKWTDHMNQVQPNKFKSQRTDVVKGKNWGRWSMAQMTKIPWMASWLDGGERVGLTHQVLVQPLTEAYDEEIRLWKEVGQVVTRAIEKRSRTDMKRHNKKIYIPEIKDDNNDGYLMGNQVLSVALNIGNQSNLKKLLLGEGWAVENNEDTISKDNPKLQAVLKHMTKSDWDLVQLVWDQMGKLYPKLAEVHRKTTSLTPPKIVASKVETPFGTYEGGFFPMKYDANRSHKAQLNEDKLNAQTESMFNTIGSIQASVNASSTNERTRYFAPVRLSLDVIPAHFQETIHYITHHDAVREINKLIINKDVADTIKKKLGPEEYAQLKPWLNSVAKDGREAPAKMFWDDALSRLRFGLTLGIMGFKASTGLMQVLGLGNSVAEVGLGNMLQSARSILGTPKTIKAAWDFAVDNSKVLSHRMTTGDREIKNAMKRLENKDGLLAGAQELSMKHIMLIQITMVDLPTWHAAYIKSMKEYGDETRAFQYADWVIENVQGSGATKDLSRIMRGQSEVAKTLTMFMTFFSSLWNQQRDVVRGASSGKYSITTTGAKVLFIIFIPVFLEMIMRGEFTDDDGDFGDDDGTALQRYLTKVALYPTSSVPFVRDIANGLTGEFGYNISPVASLIEMGVISASELIKRGFTDEEITKSQIKNSSKLVGAIFGVPGVNQAWSTGEHLYDVLENGEELTAQQLAFGPRRK